jgi:hypothetical protein
MVNVRLFCDVYFACVMLRSIVDHLSLYRLELVDAVYCSCVFLFFTAVALLFLRRALCVMADTCLTVIASKFGVGDHHSHASF